MDTNELLKIVQDLNCGKITNRELALLWGIDETSVSRKKRLKTQLTTFEILAVEKKIGKRLTQDYKNDTMTIYKDDLRLDVNYLKSISLLH